MAGNGSAGKSSSMPITGMSSTSSSALSITCPSLGSDNDVELDTDYKHRCRQLEVSLVKFKEKATRIRELLSVKMQEMESQVIEANRRTALAEDRCRELEVRLSGHGHSAIIMPPSSASSSGQERSLDVCGDYTAIVHLRAQLQEQRDLRTMEARLVAEKSAKIRDWVARKIQQMESQNQQLSSDNASLREEAKQLRERLILSASNIQPPREFLKDVQSNGWHDIEHPANSTETAMTNLNDCSDYHEVYNDDVTCSSVSASLLEPRRTVAKCAPKIHIERKQFNDTYDLMALSTASSATSNSREPSEPLLNYTSQVSSKSVDSDMQTPVELTPKEPPSPLTPYLPNPPPNTPGTDAAHPASASTLPRCKKDSQRFFATDNSNQNNNSAVLGYGTVMTIDRKYKTQGRPKRPAPPTRRVPSWENRIYSMISTGLQFPHDDLPVETVAAHQISGDKKGDAEIVIPVFATLKGKVMLIRSSPFSGNSSSDSSDEEGNIVRTTCSSFQQDRRSVADRRNDAVGKNERFSQQSRTSSAVKQRISHEGSYSSLASETSSDYAFPPEDGCSIRTESSDIELITKSVSVECSQAPVKQDMGDEKSGYLLKLSSRCKVWKQWWFVLKNGKLSYCRSPDSTQQPCHFIDLSSNSRVLKIESSQQIFQIVTAKQTIYLAAASGVIAKQWAQVIRRCVNSLSRDWQTPQVNLRVKDVINGWLVKVTNGRRRRCWCSLVGKNLIYYRASNDQTVLGELCLQGCRVEEICHSSDSDSDSYSDITTNDNDETQLGSKYTIAIWRPNACPTYLLCSSIEQKNSWLYQLTVASSGGGGCKAGTEMEQVISRLMAVDGDSSSTHWHEPIMLHTKDGVLQRPLTSVHSDDLQRKALEMFKLIRSFTWTLVDASQCDPSITIAQTLFAEALQHRELQTELYCQLIKQTSKHPASSKTPGVQHFLLCGSHSWFQCDSSPTSPTSSAADVPESKLNPPSHVIVQGWQLLTLAISLFLPSHSVMWLLKLHLHRYADSRTEAGKYAVFCQCALERALRNGSRTCRPSRLEVLSILLRNPYYHSQPISIPVHFSNGSYQVVSFDGSTTVSEFISSLEKAVGVRDASSSGFSLCSDDPTDSSREIWLLPDAKLCDVISKWEKDYVQSCGKGYDVTKTIRLCYKNRMYFSKMIRSETEKERVLFVYQTNSEVVAGRFPVSRDLALELAALMAQLEYGDFKSTSESGSSNLLLKQAVDNFYPVCYRSPLADDNKRLEQRVAEAWMLLRGKGSVDCVRVYLAVCRRWAFFGAKLFAAKLKRLNTAEKTVWLAVYEHGIAILDFTTMMMTGAHSYSNIVTFGGYCNDLVIVAVNTDSSRRQKSEHLLFSLSKVKIMEATQLISSYMNNLAFRKSETLVSSCCWKK